MEIWKTLRVSHISTPPTATTNYCLKRRYTNIPLGTKNRSGQEQLDQIAKVHDEVAVACPDYESEIKALLKAHESIPDVPEDQIPEALADLIAERFSEPE